jgi:hypothetical protein
MHQKKFSGFASAEAPSDPIRGFKVFLSLIITT